MVWGERDEDGMRHSWWTVHAGSVHICSLKKKKSATRFSIKLPCTVNQLGNLSWPSHAEILWLTIISETRSWIMIPQEQRSEHPLQLLPAIHNSPPCSLLLAIVNYAIPGVNLHNPERSALIWQEAFLRWQPHARPSLSFSLPSFLTSTPPPAPPPPPQHTHTLLRTTSLHSSWASRRQSFVPQEDTVTNQWRYFSWLGVPLQWACGCLVPVQPDEEFGCLNKTGVDWSVEILREKANIVCFLQASVTPKLYLVTGTHDGTLWKPALLKFSATNQQSSHRIL